MLKKTVRILAGCLMLVSWASAAGLVNGDFETGNLNGWTVYTDKLTANDTAIAATSAGSYSNSEVACLYSGSDGSLYGASGDSHVYLSQTFSAEAGQWLKFDYFTYCTDSYGAGRSMEDQYSCTAQIRLDFGLSPVWSMNLPVDPAGSLLDWGTASTAVFAESGNYTINFILDTSAFYSIEREAPAIVWLQTEVDNVQVVPEPASALLMGLGALAILIRRHLSR